MSSRITSLSVMLCVCLFASASHAEKAPDLTGRKGETVFFVLGMLDEYAGRSIVEDSDRVESFYCNEHVPAFVFRAYLARLAEEQGIETAIETRWNECLVSFHSKALASFINGFYSVESSSGYVDTDEGKKQFARARLPLSAVDDRDPVLQLAYLAGAYSRYGSSGQFGFANSGEKRNRVATLLKNTGSDVTDVTSKEGLPARNEVHFSPNAALRAVLDRMPDLRALDAADSLVGLASPEDLAIYREIIRVAQEGKFDGCPLPPEFDLRRFTMVPMARLSRIPGASDDQREALEDYDKVAGALLSLRELGSNSVKLVRGSTDPSPQVAFGRVGVSRDRTCAMTLFSYHAGSADPACLRVAAVFMERQGDTWSVSGFSSP